MSGYLQGKLIQYMEVLKTFDYAVVINGNWPVQHYLVNSIELEMCSHNFIRLILQYLRGLALSLK